MRFVFINTGTLRQDAGIIRSLGFGTRLACRGHDVTLILSNQPENLKRYGSFFRGVRFLYTARGAFVEEVSKLLILLRLKPVHVVHSMGAEPKIFLPALAARKVLRRKYLLVVDYEDKQSLLVPAYKVKVLASLENLSLMHADMIVCASRFLEEEYAAKVPGKTLYIPMGFEFTNVMRPNGRREDGLNGKVRLGYAGKLIGPYEDQVRFLLEPFPLLKARVDGVELHLIGDGPSREHFEKRCREQTLEDSIIFHGHVEDDELLPLLTTMNALVFPYANKPLNIYRCPHKAFLYAQTGLPIVTNPVGEVYALLQDYPQAYFFAESDFQSFADAVLRSLKSTTISDIHGYYQRRSWDALSEVYLTKCLSRGRAALGWKDN